MLVSLLRTYLRPYTRPLVAVVVLQFLGTLAALYLPTLNADIIDDGVAKADTAYILEVGAIMLGITLVQVVCTIGAVYFGARSAMGFGRDARAAIFHRVGSFSAREMTRFGAPSLITRTTNDVQQVQMLVLLTCTMMVSAPIMCIGGIIMALRQDVGMAWLIALSVTALVVAIAIIVSRMVPQFRRMQVRLDAVNRVLREQITGIRVVRAFVREPVERERFVARERRPDGDLAQGRAADGAHVPHRDAGAQRVERGRAVVRRRAHRRRRRCRSVRSPPS